jgi:hypothetical protein
VAAKLIGAFVRRVFLTFSKKLPQGRAEIVAARRLFIEAFSLFGRSNSMVRAL